MADRARIEQALIAADQAGDTAAATQLAQALRGMAPAAQPQGPVDFSAGEMVSNIPESAYRYGEGIVSTITSPIESAKGIGKLFMGGIEKGAEAAEEALPEGVVGAINSFNNYLVDLGVPLDRIPETGFEADPQRTQYADAVGEFVKSRYGSVDALKTTAMEDPVGILADAASVLTGAGLVTAAATPGRVGSTLTRVGTALEPLNVITSAAKTSAKVIPKGLPRKLYQASAKFGTTKEPAQRARMVDTALEHGIAPTTKGAEKLGNKIDQLGGKVDRLVGDATEAGRNIPIQKLGVHIRELRREMGSPTTNIEAARDVRMIDKVVKDYLAVLKKSGKTSLTPDEAQALKRNLYKRIDFDRSQGKAQLPKEETFKALGRGAKESLEEVAPGIGEINAELGSLLELRQPLEQAAANVENLSAGGRAKALLNLDFGTAVFGDRKAQGAMALKLHELRSRGVLDTWIDQNIPRTAGRLGTFQAGREEE